MEWSIKHFSQLSNVEVYEIIKLRTDVFVVEQQSIYADCDNKDLEAFHLQLRDEAGQLLGYLRLLNQGVSYKTYSIGRVIITPPLRRSGFGEQMLQRAIAFIASHWQGDAITISAQQQLTRFYERVGFVVESDPYIEDGIYHIQMRLELNDQS
ncbi:GNAT family N-acetyltransferase [Paenibacillus endoradicis]|uniref:GNAT family N-acetyltransferase n=1 Tax=Paenibacillus endoradicis TaxID=2972487 RepID=UPI002158E9D1|nr:GNAT family N-acetyltransferase [Paenibacillus endoradicis]MCR8659658.1 GNAT family N-acetyltransferase [Paenibacillus endoradicis]